MTNEPVNPNNLSNSSYSGPPPQHVKLKNWDRRRKIVALTSVPALFIGSFIFSIPVAFFFLANPTGVPIQLAVAITIAAELLVLFWAIKFAGLKPLKDALFLRLHKWWHLLVGAGVGLLAYAGLQGLASATQLITGETLESSDTSTSLGAAGGGLLGALFLILVVGILAPTLEEFYFRGMILGSLKGSTWNAKWLMILISAVSFGIMHIQGFDNLTDIMIFLWITVMGGVFAYLTLKLNSIWPAVAAHIAYNMVTSIAIIALF